jgi:hypothetical protein
MEGSNCLLGLFRTILCSGSLVSSNLDAKEAILTNGQGRHPYSPYGAIAWFFPNVRRRHVLSARQPGQ